MTTMDYSNDLSFMSYTANVGVMLVEEIGHVADRVSLLILSQMLIRFLFS